MYMWAFAGCIGCTNPIDVWSAQQIEGGFWHDWLAAFYNYCNASTCHVALNRFRIIPQLLGRHLVSSYEPLQQGRNRSRELNLSPQSTNAGCHGHGIPFPSFHVDWPWCFPDLRPHPPPPICYVCTCTCMQPEHCDQSNWTWQIDLISGLGLLLMIR